MSRPDTGWHESRVFHTTRGSAGDRAGQGQSAEQDKYPGAANLASGVGFSGTSDNVYAVLSSKGWAHNGEKIRYLDTCVT